MLNPDLLRAELMSALQLRGAITETRFGRPNPKSSNWKLVTDFTHPAGLGNVSIWENAGCCDIGFLPIGGGDAIWLHGEFENDEVLLQFVSTSLVSLLGTSN
jgi:hypothetical protein